MEIVEPQNQKSVTKMSIEIIPQIEQMPDGLRTPRFLSLKNPGEYVIAGYRTNIFVFKDGKFFREIQTEESKVSFFSLKNYFE